MNEPNNNNQFSFEMHSALEQFNEHRNTLKMTTGTADLDSLIDGIQEGLFYLFYDNNYAVQDSLVYRFLVNCVLPITQNMALNQWAFVSIAQTIIIVERHLLAQKS
jgi:hypothetical protein